MKVKEIMTPDPLMLSINNSVEHAARFLDSHDFDGAPVVDARSRFLGYIGKKEIIRHLLHNRDNAATLRELPLNTIATVSTDDEVEEVICRGITRALVLDGRGRPVGIIALSDLLQGVWKKARHESYELSAIFSAAHSGIITVGLDGTITRCNDSAAVIFQKSQEELLKLKIQQLLPALNLERIISRGEKEIAQKLKFGEKTLVAEKVPIILEGRVTGAIIFLRDISDFKSVVSEIESVRELSDKVTSVIQSSQAILESTSDGLYITDGKGVTIRINQAYEDMTQILETEIIGRSVYELEKEGFFSPSVTVRVLQQRKPVTLRQKVRNGKEFLVTGNPIFDEDGNLIMVVSNVRDISELRELEEKLKKAQELTERYYTELEEMRIQLLESEDIVAKDQKMVEILQLAKRVAQVDTTVMILGETGVGKEEIAKFIHKHSKRAEKGQFIKINCGAIPPTLIESELFGYEKGAFTGASREGKMGLFEVAEGGTIFLDEIGELPLDMQVKLLRALQEKEIKRVGGIKPIKIDVRILAATNRNLEEMVREKRFREDLYYRLNVIPIHIPPLRERKEDIFALTLHFLSRFNEEYGWNKSISSEVLNCFYHYGWPGNVRELKNVLERLVVLTEGEKICCEHLPQNFQAQFKAGELQPLGIQFGTLRETLAHVEKELIMDALKKHKSIRAAAKALGIDHATLIRKKNRYIADV